MNEKVQSKRRKHSRLRKNAWSWSTVLGNPAGNYCTELSNVDSTTPVEHNPCRSLAIKVVVEAITM